MDSKDSAEAEREEKEFQNKLNDFRKLQDTAYQLFDGKYSMEQISRMPYKILLAEMEREQKNIEKNADQRASKKMEKDLKKVGL